MNGTTLAQGVNNAEGNMIAGQAVFSPNNNAQILGAGQSTTFSFTVNTPVGSGTPAIASVDGASGSSMTPGGANDGFDHTARAVATGALNVAVAYEANKPANNGDANYGQYDGFIWSAHSFIISNGKMAWDPNVPGYAYVSNQAQAQLEAMQDNPAVAAYLVAGLQSCFNDTKAQWVYDFRAQVLKGYQNNTTTTGTMGGTLPDQYAYRPSGYNVNSVLDHYTTVGMAPGSNVINVTETSSASPSTAQDFWFGLLTYTSLANFSNTSAVSAKFNNNAQTAACSPFNGPGGTANPYLVIKLNGTVVPARFQGVGAQCYQSCTSTLTLDPDAYAIPGPYYNSMGLVGPQANPFGFDPAATSATTDHGGQYATTWDANGNPIYGEFMSPIVHRGVTTGYNWVQCGIGAGC
jgi:hypothetical protein